MDEKFILALARRTVETFIAINKKISVPEKYPNELNEKRGIFVTIYKIGRVKELKGCVGIPYPEMPLIKGIIEASVSACQDMRFSSLTKQDIKNIRLEISILTEPELIEVKDPKEYLKKIKIGQDGLIIKKGVMSGLLLPQVPLEYKWNVEEYLKNLCYKAGLLADSWSDGSVKIYMFEAHIIKE
jgi:uncharacterized protein (TIGR00296 family)